MPRRRRLTAFAALSLSAAIALTGCSGGQSYSDLSGDRETEDELPGLPDYAYESVDTGSSRFVGEHEGASLWLAEGTEASTICLVVVPDDDQNWVVGCGGDSLGVGGLAGDFTVEPDGGLPPDGAAAISKNVYAG